MIHVSRATGPVYKVALRRRRKALTNYAKRLALVKGNAPRMVVRKSGRGITVQFLEFSAKGDRVIAGGISKALRKMGWAPRCNAPTAYLCGLLAGRAAAKKGVKEFNLDIGMQTPSKGSVVFAALRGAMDAGLKTAYSNDMIEDSRINGSLIEKYAKELRAKDAARYNKLFSSYIKENFNPEKMVEAFNAAKAKIGGI